MSFSFVGKIPPSKSILNRWLILKSFCPELHQSGVSEAEDVQLMKAAVDRLLRRTAGASLEFDCGHAGTVLRFLALRVARERGRFILTGNPRLFTRPMNELVKVLKQLGSFVEVSDTKLEIQSDGWRLLGDQLYIPSDRSSQFASAFLLSAWNLPFEIFFRTTEEPVSQPYFQMTLEMVKSFGMQVRNLNAGEFYLSARQTLVPCAFEIEPDMSSAFAVAACAAVDGEARFKDWPEVSLQPDVRFVGILERMGAAIERGAGVLSVSRAKTLKPVCEDLRSAPDLFPVLAALCALAEGTSELRGLRHLAYKESSRAENMHKLLTALGVRCEISEDEMKIFGQGRSFSGSQLDWEPDRDHRIAMAGAVLQLAGAPVRVLHPDVVKKSFPEFWAVIKGAL